MVEVALTLPEAERVAVAAAELEGAGERVAVSELEAVAVDEGEGEAEPDAVALGDAEGDVEVVAEVVAEHVAVAELEIAVFVQAQAADESVAANAKARNTVRVERSSVAAASE
jgi:hypothetical protein